MSTNQSCGEPKWWTDLIVGNSGSTNINYYYYPYYDWDYNYHSVPAQCEICKGAGRIMVREGAYYDVELSKIVYPNKRAKKEIKDCKACDGKGFIWLWGYRKVYRPVPVTPWYSGTYIQTTTGANSDVSLENTVYNAATVDAQPVTYRDTLGHTGCVQNGRIYLS